MGDIHKTKVVEQPPYDWTKNREVLLTDDKDRQYPAFLGYEIPKTTEENLWWQKVFQEIDRKIDAGELISLSYLSHLALGKLIAFWNKTWAEISERENYAGIHEKQNLDRVRPKTRPGYEQARSFRLQWANRILNGELPTEEEFQRSGINELGINKLDYKLRSILLQGVVIKHPEMAMKLPYVGLTPFEEAEIAIRSLLEQRMREVKELDAAN